MDINFTSAFLTTLKTNCQREGKADLDRTISFEKRLITNIPDSQNSIPAYIIIKSNKFKNITKQLKQKCLIIYQINT